MLVIGNIKMEFRHPNYYKELRKRNKSDQAISSQKTVDVGDSVRPDPGHKLDVPAPAGPSVKPQAASVKHQASSRKRLEAVE